MLPADPRAPRPAAPAPRRRPAPGAPRGAACFLGSGPPRRAARARAHGRRAGRRTRRGRAARFTKDQGAAPRHAPYTKPIPNLSGTNESRFGCTYSRRAPRARAPHARRAARGARRPASPPKTPPPLKRMGARITWRAGARRALTSGARNTARPHTSGARRHGRAAAAPAPPACARARARAARHPPPANKWDNASKHPLASALHCAVSLPAMANACLVRLQAFVPRRGAPHAPPGRGPDARGPPLGPAAPAAASTAAARRPPPFLNTLHHWQQSFRVRVCVCVCVCWCL
ncbi:MAG: hypothetical protein J3K34DRAFT_39677 [Monoraphidium minutum]|nr:MAG: hypothetical protein J3K34DRAFT_39677 [Monoraphidium minutum]